MKKNMLSKTQIKEISHTSEIRIRFAETDPLSIVWHGNYIQYFEDGREAFGRAHGISYLDQKAHGFTTPIVKTNTEHKLPLFYGDIATIKTTFINSNAAKMVFKYQIFNAKNQVVCEGSTTQVFVSHVGEKMNEGELQLVAPKFFLDWKRKVGLLDE